MAKTKKYKVNSFNLGVLPHIVSDAVGVEDFDKLQSGETVTLPANLPPHILQYFDEVKEAEKASTEKTEKVKNEEKSK